jgi:uncharacterized membrane protein YebE (DUF533 family)
MDTKAFLEQLLESGRKLAEQGLAQGKEIAAQGKDAAKQGMDYASDKLNLPEAGPERDKMLKNLGLGAAAGGLLALLVGTKSGRKVLSPAVKLGSLAALGGLGYKVYTEWQKKQGLESNGQPIANLSGADANDRAMSIVKAMISAAKADGSIDAGEQKLIVDQIESSNLDDSASQILMTELQKPLNVNEIAAGADSPEAAVEIYLASLLLTDKSNAQEQAYLDQLANSMKLDSDLVTQLESQAFAS